MGSILRGRCVGVGLVRSDEPTCLTSQASRHRHYLGLRSPLLCSDQRWEVERVNPIMGGSSTGVASEVWEQPDMRAALAAHDLAAVYLMLSHQGISQRRIAALTSQGQSDISETLKGRRVMAYEVLARIADGLGVPRGYMGLAFDSSTAITVAGTNPAHAGDEEEESVRRRRFLAHAAAVAVGAVTNRWQPAAGVDAATPAPSRIGLIDVEQLEAVTRSLRTVDYQYGGGACRQALLAHLSWAHTLLDADAADAVRRRLQLAVADTHNLAGWTSHDIGLDDSARSHFAQALELARAADDPSLIANVLYRSGRLHLHRGHAIEALRLFQLGQITAQDTGDALTVALLCVNEAWAYAVLEDSRAANASLGRAADEFSRADGDTAPAWVRFFGAADLHATTGVTLSVLSAQDQRWCAPAVAELTASTSSRGHDMTRSRAFELTAMATAHLRAGDRDHGCTIGAQAVDLAEQLRSTRVIERLQPLRAETARHLHDPDARQLAERITALAAA